MIPVIRCSSSEDARRIVDALFMAGIRIVELTMTTPNVYHLIDNIWQDFPNMLVGVGTIRDGSMALHAIESGVDFLVTYKVAADVAKIGQNHTIPISLERPPQRK